MKQFYFHKYEDRRPYQAISDNSYRTLLFQFTGIVTILLGFYYLYWRWKYSLNPDALWFSILLVVAETLSFLSTFLIIINFWSYKDAEKTPPVHYLSEIEEIYGLRDRPVRIDIFIATYNEDVELVRQSIIDAKKITYPFSDVKIKIYVLDDGRRDGSDPAKENMKRVAEEENVNYFIREHNQGYKAGNLKNALENTKGDLFVILDADTRTFPTFLEHTTGYFRKPKVAWVQTPQWFYDTTEAEQLSSIINCKLKITNKKIRKIITSVFGRIKINEDLFGNDPRLFYDVILRKRNFHNAAFCCGAGSIHRREAVMSLALKEFVENIKRLETDLTKLRVADTEIKSKKKNVLLEQELIPFKFHASEDIYTSMMLHADKQNRWESIQHPDIECKMLSTQDVDSWVKQHQRYAEGSLDIAFKDNPLFKRGLTWRQKLCYFSTIWSYFAPLWIIIFLFCPVIYFFSLSLPVRAYSFDFFKHFLPFQIMNTITITLGCWGISTKRGDQYYISSFWVMLMSLITIIRGKKVKFNVTPKNIGVSKSTQHILPHAIIIFLTLIGILYNAILVAINQHPAVSGFAANTFWSLFNIVSLSVIIRAAFWKPVNESIYGN